MADLNGRDGRVVYDGADVLSQTEWTLSGFIQNPAETTAFTDAVKTFILDGSGNPGTLSFVGHYDPSDAAQAAISAICEIGSVLENRDGTLWESGVAWESGVTWYGGKETLCLYESSNAFWRVAEGGSLIITDTKNVSMARNGIARVYFKGQISGAAIERRET